MTGRINSSPLDSEKDWDSLAGVIDPNKGELAQSLISHLKDIGAKYVFLENGYLDRDFTVEFSEFYSKVFKPYGKFCKRLLFFSEDCAQVLSNGNPEILAKELEKLGDKSFLGFIVIRPLLHAPIGRTVLRSPPKSKQCHILVRALHETHLLGATLKVEGFPFVQQDKRVGACAQASIWAAARHFHIKHREPWCSIVDITDYATNPIDGNLSLSLPAGSGGLYIDNMVRALRQIGREPLLYAGQVNNSFPFQISWPDQLRPYDIINRYVDSRIPVILLLCPWEQTQNDGHAVVVVGHTLKNIKDSSKLPIKPTRAEFCENFNVNDDQRGCYLNMPIKSGGSGCQTPYSVLDHVYGIIIPLPSKVYMKAEFAEIIFWATLDHFISQSVNLVNTHKDLIGDAVKIIEELKKAYSDNKIIARTYLTTGWKYKRLILRNHISDSIKNLIIERSFPRYVWVIEYGTLNSLNKSKSSDRYILGHMVIDATSSIDWENTLLAHFPGFLSTLDHDPEHPSQQISETIFPIANDKTYLPRRRVEH